MIMKSSLKQFDPNKVASIETRMWQAYYRHHFFILFTLLIKLMKESFGLNYLSCLEAAYYAASAAIDFRMNRGKENENRIRRKLTEFYRTISKRSLEGFDYKKAAELELNWWLIDRYPQKFVMTRQEAIKIAMAEIYNIEPAKLNEYADYRAQAMVLQDEAESLNKEADWDKV
jgi:hypothetical protein